MSAPVTVRAHYCPEHELWRYVIYRFGAVVSKSEARYINDLEALHYGRKQAGGAQ
jgi:hypothetical protein